MNELKKLIKDTMKVYPCCVCGSPSSYFLKPKGAKIAQAYCEFCSKENPKVNN